MDYHDVKLCCKTPVLHLEGGIVLTHTLS